MKIRPLLFALVILLAFLLVVCGQPAVQAAATQSKQTQYISIASAGPTTMYFIISAGIGQVVTKYAPYIKINVEPTAGVVENTKLVQTGQSTLGIGPTDTVYFAYKGGREYKVAYPKLRLVMNGHASIWHFGVNADSNVKAIADLKGKRITTGKGGAQDVTVPAILEAHGIGPSDAKVIGASAEDRISQMKDGSVDAIIYGDRVPSPGFQDLARAPGIRMLPLTEEGLKRIIEKHPYWTKGVIPAGSYKGQDQQVLALNCPNAYFTSIDVDADLVYTFVKIVLEHTDELNAIHPAGSEYVLKNALFGSNLLPLHPGAARYYKEKGVLK